MTDRQISFSAPMIRALLEGRKTQTRRVLKLVNRLPDYIGPRGCTDDPSCWGWSDDDRGDYWLVKRGDSDEGRLDWSDWAGAYRSGDRLWVREAWRCLNGLDPFSGAAMARQCVEVAGYRKPWAPIQYEADGERVDWIRGPGFGFVPGRYRHGRFMPRWASRLTLIVTDVRVERLQEISEADAISEGCRPFFDRENTDEYAGPNGSVIRMLPLRGPVDDFHRLWDSLNAKRGIDWQANPWVCAITFTVHHKNIDQMEAA